MAPGGTINVLRVAIYPEEISKRHHTGHYDLIRASKPTAVLRRGFNFFINILFDRQYDFNRDRVRIVFKFGKETSRIDDSHQTLALVDPHQKFPENVYKWGIRLDAEFPDKSITVEVRIPPNALVGQWQYDILTNIGNDYQHTKPFPELSDHFFIIFNPWIPEDDVYMEDEEERNEYVLNDAGKVWYGTYNNPKGKHWLFGQFEEVALPTAAFLLDKSGLKTGQRGSPVMVARTISAIVNSKDDKGLLRQKVDGKYSKGLSPHLWTGSAAILDQYYKSGGEPVKYAQCWVYSAVVVTICRALGIPCRSVTNYVSSPDPVAISFNSYGELVLNGPDTHDFGWSFHAWNEVWMTRPDLPSGYGGWQVIDGTPLREIEGIKILGPASVAAVKQGEVGYSYDTPFVFSEVNSNIVHYRLSPDGNVDLVRTSMNKYQAGKNIVTRKIGAIDDRWDGDVLDITSLYKFEEGSIRKNNALKKATKFAPQSLERYYIEIGSQDLNFELVDIDTVTVGDPFLVLLRVRNVGFQRRTIRPALHVHSVFYTGNVANNIVTDNFKNQSYVVEPRDIKTFKITVNQEMYSKKLVDHGIVKIHAYVYVEETKEVWSEEDDFAFTPPPLLIEAPEYSRKSEIVDVQFSFQNPLNIPLTECIYMIEGPTVKEPLIVKLGDIKSLERVFITESFRFEKLGKRRIIFNFTSKNIQGINGTVTINVLDN